MEGEENLGIINQQKVIGKTGQEGAGGQSAARGLENFSG